MKKLLVTGALALLGAVVPAGMVGTAGASVTHDPILGKHVVHLNRLSAGALHNGTAVQSPNWSGYADSGDTFTSVSAQWIEPAVTCHAGGGGLLGLGSSATYAAFWVGLDGYSSTSVEQDGADSDCLASGAPNYYAWYEMYPASPVDLSQTTYPVTPGDHMAAAVKSNTAGTSFTLALVDTSTQHAGWMFSTTVSSSGLPRSSAEWVAEAPTSCSLLIFCATVGLSNFGSVAFSNAQATDVAGKTGSISSFTDTPLQMASNGSVEATPSPLTAGGTAFTDTWGS
ncbi:MAG TPA: G1 family glutamic endopeptidase [Acidimicrobiales bacterium]|nr:G1 family glutamic endopeptidase [Acidimicrobiales bacterium]